MERALSASVQYSMKTLYELMSPLFASESTYFLRPGFSKHNRSHLVASGDSAVGALGILRMRACDERESLSSGRASSSLLQAARGGEGRGRRATSVCLHEHESQVHVGLVLGPEADRGHELILHLRRGCFLTRETGSSRRSHPPSSERARTYSKLFRATPSFFAPSRFAGP